MGLTPSSLKRAAKAQRRYSPAEKADLRQAIVDFGNNPDPERFTVLQVEGVGPHCVARINYPDATNYEGTKVLLYLHTNPEAVWEAKQLDPHFAESGNPPFARFEPTGAGWSAAIFLANALADRGV